jgi:hypothetical protein
MEESTTRVDLRRIFKTTPYVLRQIGVGNKCVPASAILMKTLHRCGYPDAYPLSVRLEIMNAAMHAYVATHGRPGPHETNAELASSGALCSTVGNPLGSDWAGHMGIVVPDYFDERHAFMDLTLMQANVPERGIQTGPVCVEAPQRFVDGIDLLPVSAYGCHLTYEAFPADHGYDEGTNWMKMRGLDRAVQMVIDRLG